MKNKNKVLFGILTLLTVLILIYGGSSYYFNTHLFPNTYVDNINVGFLSDEAAVEKLSTAAEIDEIIIKKNNDTIEVLDLSGLTHCRQYESLAEIIDRQDAIRWPLYCFTRKNVDISYVNIVDEAGLSELYSGLRLLLPENQQPSKDAYVIKNEETGQYEIVSEVYGSAVKEDELFDKLKECIIKARPELSLEAEGLYIRPELCAEDDYIVSKAALLNKLQKLELVMDFSAEEKHRLDTEYIYSFYLEPALGDFSLNEDRVNELADMSSLRYDTSPESGIRLFHSASGRTVTIKTRYGWRLDKEKTKENIRGCLNEISAFLQSTEEEKKATINAVWSSTALTHKSRDIGDTYAEVDITNQMVYMIKDKKLVFESPCVTGLLVAGRRTPDGIYSITYKQPGKVLTGRRPDGSISYQSPVSFWMPFNKGIGFHDATWRKSFGGDIYKRNGSHGCINMPFDKAKELYQLVYKGMPVVCYF